MLVERLREKKMDILIWGFCLIFTILYASLLFSHNIFTDEAFTILLIKKNLSGIIQGTAADVHPPFYYLYLKLWGAIFGNSLVAIKTASLLPMTGTLILGATAVRKRFGDVTALFYILFLACIPCTMEFSVQIRMYSLAILFVTACALAAYDAFMEGKWTSFLVMGISGVAAAYTHYFAFMPVTIIIGFLLGAILIKNRKILLTWIITAVCMIIVYLPWIFSFIKQIKRVNGGYWIPEINLYTVWGYFKWTFDLKILPGTVFLFLILLKVLHTKNIIVIARKCTAVEIYALLCMLVPTLTMMIGVVISIYTTPIYRDQYIFPSLGLLALFVGIVLCGFGKKLLLLIGIFLVLIGVGGYKESWYQEYESTLLPQTEALLKDVFNQSDYIVYNYKLFDFIYEAQFPEYPKAYVEDFDWSGDFERVWFFNTSYEIQLDPAILESNGLAVETIGHYGIEHNEFDIYMIYHSIEE